MSEPAAQRVDKVQPPAVAPVRAAHALAVHQALVAL
jgi:hypothetical protein